MSLRCYVIDDDPACIAVLCKHIGKTPDLELVGAESDPVIALKKLLNREVVADILFLDIQMEPLDGRELALQVKDLVTIIFVTGNEHFAREAFDQDVTDFLWKPFSYERFLHSKDKAKEIVEYRKAIRLAGPSRLALKSGKMTFIVEPEDVTCVRSDSNTVDIFFSNRDRLVCRYQLYELEAKLTNDFFMKIHRSYIINLNKVESVEGNIVKLYNGAVAYIGKSYREEFMKKMGL